MIRKLALLIALVLFMVAGLILVAAFGDNPDPTKALGLVSFGLAAVVVAKLVPDSVP